MWFQSKPEDCKVEPPEAEERSTELKAEIKEEEDQPSTSAPQSSPAPGQSKKKSESSCLCEQRDQDPCPWCRFIDHRAFILGPGVTDAGKVSSFQKVLHLLQSLAWFTLPGNYFYKEIVNVLD